MTFRNLLEKTDQTVIYVRDELWMTYGPGSGMTSYLPDLKKYLNSDNTDKEHFDSMVTRITGKGITNKVLKSKGNATLFEVPYYKEGARGNDKYDIWGGTVKRDKLIYMIVTEEKSTIINFFEKKNEALNWMRSLA